MKNDIKFSIPKNCDNAPKKRVLRDFNIAFVSEDRDFIDENIADKITWKIVGSEEFEGKEEVLDQLMNYHTGEINELIIHHVITHGYVASTHGIVLGTEDSYDFCHVYRFTGASKTAKIKKITSYIIPKKD